MISQQTLTSEIRVNLRGTFHDEVQGDLSVGQSVWRYKDGRFLVYGSDADVPKIYYVLISETLWGNLDAEDFAPYPPASFSGELKLSIGENEHIISFGQNTRLVYISADGKVSILKVNLNMEQWKQIMQPYANSIKNSDLEGIYKKLWALPRVKE